MNFRSKSRGFTVIELMVVTAIVVVAIVAIVNRVQAARQTSQVSAETGNLSAIESKLRSAFAGRPNYVGLTTALLLAQNGFPAQMVNNGVVSHVWGGNVSVVPAAGNLSADVTYENVPSSPCVEFVMNVSRAYNEVTVGSTKTKNGAQVADLDAVQTACTAAPLTNITYNIL